VYHYVWRHIFKSIYSKLNIVQTVKLVKWHFYHLPYYERLPYTLAQDVLLRLLYDKALFSHDNSLPNPIFSRMADPLKPLTFEKFIYEYRLYIHYGVSTEVKKFAEQ